MGACLVVKNLSTNLKLHCLFYANINKTHKVIFLLGYEHASFMLLTAFKHFLCSAVMCWCKMGKQGSFLPLCMNILHISPFALKSPMSATQATKQTTQTFLVYKKRNLHVSERFSLFLIRKDCSALVGVLDQILE